MVGIAVLVIEVDTDQVGLEEGRIVGMGLRDLVLLSDFV